MRLTHPLDKIFNSEIKVRALRVFCRADGELGGRQIAKMIGVTPKTAHEVLQKLLKEGVLLMRVVGKNYLFRLNEDLEIVRSVLKRAFIEENGLRERLLGSIAESIRQSPLKDNILSVALFGSVYKKTEQPMSDVDLLIVVKAAGDKKKIEDFFFKIDESIASRWGNPLAPYLSSLSEFQSKARKKTGVLPAILKSYQLIYGDRLEKFLR